MGGRSEGANTEATPGTVRHTCRRTHGMACTRSMDMGMDIDMACGQHEHEVRTNNDDGIMNGIRSRTHGERAAGRGLACT